MITRTRPWFLFAPDDGTGSNPPNDPPKDPPGNNPPANDPANSEDPPKDPPGSASDEPKLTQAQVDAMFDREFGKRKAKWEKDLADYAEREGQTEAERLKAEKADAEKATADARQEVLAERVSARAERAALAAGVKPERVDQFLRVVDLTDLDSLTDDGKPDDDAIAKVIGSTLEDLPEFKTSGGSGKPPSGGGDFGGSGGGPKQWTREEISKLTPSEYEKHEDEIKEQMRAGSIK